jgi:hypothetical protein
MVVDWNELPQVAALNLAFVQHGYPLLAHCMEESIRRNHYR